MDDRTKRKHQFDTYMAEMTAQISFLSCPNCQRLGDELLKWAKDAYEYSERAKDLEIQLKRTHEIYAQREQFSAVKPLIVETPKE